MHIPNVARATPPHSCVSVGQLAEEEDSYWLIPRLAHFFPVLATKMAASAAHCGLRIWWELQYSPCEADHNYGQEKYSFQYTI